MIVKLHECPAKISYWQVPIIGDNYQVYDDWGCNLKDKHSSVHHTSKTNHTPLHTSTCALVQGSSQHSIRREGGSRVWCPHQSILGISLTASKSNWLKKGGAVLCCFGWGPVGGHQAYVSLPGDNAMYIQVIGRTPACPTPGAHEPPKVAKEHPTPVAYKKHLLFNSRVKCFFDHYYSELTCTLAL